MDFNTIVMSVDGAPVDIDFVESLSIGDISDDMVQVPASIAYWSAVWAAAESERMRADAAYRNWRAQKGEECLHADPKLAEWKVRQRIELDPMFTQLKAALAKAEQNVINAKGICDAYKVKANLLQSIGAMERLKREKTKVATKRSAKVSGAPDAESAMRKANQKRAKKPKTAE